MKPYLTFISFLLNITIFPSMVWSAQKKPNVILITIDALRADHLHCYGYEKDTSPTMDRLAAEGVLFENASTTSTRTTQSLAAMITGRYPQSIGVRTLYEKLKLDEVTLAEVLKQHGYYTGAVIANPVVKNRQLDQGFDFFSVTHKQVKAIKTNELFLSWLGQHQDRPVFAWVHYEDPRMPYFPPGKFKNIHDYSGRFEKGFGFFQHPDDLVKIKHELFKPKVVYHHTILPQRELKRIRALYDGEIAYTDMALGRLLEDMKSLGFMENTLLVVSADHGESLGEHQYYFAHGEFVYQPTSRVPLIFHWPGKIPPNRRISQNTQTIDILPSVLSFLGITDPFSGHEGRDLAGAASGKADLVGIPVYTESGESLWEKYNTRRYVSGIKGKIRSIREGNWKLILSPTKSEPILELYNLGTDPSETKNLAVEKPERTRKMARKLQEWMRKGEHHVIVPKDRNIKKLLRALGYIQ